MKVTVIWVRWWLTFVVGLLAGEGARASIMFAPWPLDSGIGHADMIVAGQISLVREPTRTAFFSMPNPSFQFQVSHVLFGDAGMAGKVLDFPNVPFYWPGDLVELQKGACCILFLDSRQSTPMAVVASSRSGFPLLKDRKNVRTLLVNEILVDLAAETSLVRQRSLIMQVAPAVTASEAKALLPFVKHENRLVAQAALAAVVYATRDPRYVELAVADLKRFFREHDPRKESESKDLVSDPALRAAGVAPYPLIFTHYFFLWDTWYGKNRALSNELAPLQKLVRDMKLSVPPEKGIREPGKD